MKKRISPKPVSEDQLREMSRDIVNYLRCRIPIENDESVEKVRRLSWGMVGLLVYLTHNQKIQDRESRGLGFKDFSAFESAYKKAEQHYKSQINYFLRG